MSASQLTRSNLRILDLIKKRALTFKKLDIFMDILPADLGTLTPPGAVGVILQFPNSRVYHPHKGMKSRSSQMLIDTLIIEQVVGRYSVEYAIKEQYRVLECLKIRIGRGHDLRDALAIV